MCAGKQGLFYVLSVSTQLGRCRLIEAGHLKRASLSKSGGAFEKREGNSCWVILSVCEGKRKCWTKGKNGSDTNKYTHQPNGLSSLDCMYE